MLKIKLHGNKNPLISSYPLVKGSKIQWHPTKNLLSAGSLGSGNERKQCVHNPKLSNFAPIKKY